MNTQSDNERRDTPNKPAPDDRRDESGAEEGSPTDTQDKLPFVPTDDDTLVGDTDQHSNA
jgi:hypothetical protein